MNLKRVLDFVYSGDLFPTKDAYMAAYLDSNDAEWYAARPYLTFGVDETVSLNERGIIKQQELDIDNL